MPSTDIEVWAEKVSATSVMLKMAAEIDKVSTLDDGQLDPSVLQIVGGILGATDEDAIFAAANAGTISGKNFLNIPFLLQGSDIQWKKSRETFFKDQKGFPWYTLMRVTNLQTGEMQTLNCGGWTHVSTMWRLLQVKAFDKYLNDGGMPLMLLGKPVASGFTVVIPTRYQLPKVVANGGRKAKESAS